MGSGPAPGGGGPALKARLPRQQRASSGLSVSATSLRPPPRGHRRQSWRHCDRTTATRTRVAMSLGDRASFGPPLHFRSSFRFRRKPSEAALSSRLGGEAVCPQVVEESWVVPLLGRCFSETEKGGAGCGRRALGNSSLGSWAGPGGGWKTKTSQDQNIGTSGPESSSRLRLCQLQETGDPLLLPSLKAGQVELRGLGPQSRSYPIIFEVIIISHDLEKIINKTFECLG